MEMQNENIPEKTTSDLNESTTSKENMTKQKTGDESITFESRIDLRELQQSVYAIKQELQKVIVGQREMVDLLLVTILADGHALIEGVPGVAKTIRSKRRPWNVGPVRSLGSRRGPSLVRRIGVSARPAPKPGRCSET